MAPRLLQEALAASEFVNADPNATGLSAFRPESVVNVRAWTGDRAGHRADAREEVRRLGDVFVPCGATTGQVPYCKIGDAIATVGPDSAAAGRRVAIEAKAQKGYDVVRALDEVRAARENRDAEVGIFVFDKRVAPLGVEPIARFGNDLVAVWDSDDPSTDIRLRLAYSVARALLVAQARTAANARLDFAVVDSALTELRKRTESLEEVLTWTQTIKNSSEKIEARTRAAREALNTQIERLQQQLESLRRE